MSTITSTIESGVLTIKVAGHGSITIDPAEYAADIRNAAMLHGFKQKVVDAAALSRNETTGASATAADKFNAMRDVEHQLLSGDWNKRATGGDGSLTRGLLIEALIRVTGNTVDVVTSTVQGWDDTTQAAMRGSAAVAPMIAIIKAERAARRPVAAGSGFDASAKLAELMTPPVVVEPVAEPVVKKAKVKIAA